MVPNIQQKSSKLRNVENNNFIVLDVAKVLNDENQTPTSWCSQKRTRKLTAWTEKVKGLGGPSKLIQTQAEQSNTQMTIQELWLIFGKYINDSQFFGGQFWCGNCSKEEKNWGRKPLPFKEIRYPSATVHVQVCSLRLFLDFVSASKHPQFRLLILIRKGIYSSCT